jgi:hypothetical protein
MVVNAVLNIARKGTLRKSESHLAQTAEVPKQTETKDVKLEID